MGKVSTVELQIAERARKYPTEALTNLQQFIDETYLHECFMQLNKKSAKGVDNVGWTDYDEQRSELIPRLLAAFKNGKYRAPHIRRVYIPKGDGGQRPLGLPTVEDKLLQTAVTNILTPIYEELFYDTSFGFRPGKSQHQAISKLFEEVSYRGKRYVIDADMKNYFGSINHQCLRDFLDLRIKDGVIRKMIDKWLKAGIFENGGVSYPKEGTPQGGTISPLLSNIYLHYVLDEWFTKQIRPLLKGGSFMIRYADDFLLGFSNLEDAERVLKVLPKRLGRFGLTLHPEKTKLVNLKGDDENKPGTFDFLGFTHYLGKSRKGKRILKRKTSGKKLRKALVEMNKWLRNNRHLKLVSMLDQLNQKLRGHYEYYGITFNSRSLKSYYFQTVHLLHKWLNRRGGKRVWNWERLGCLVTKWIPLIRPRIYQSCP